MEEHAQHTPGKPLGASLALFLSSPALLFLFLISSTRLGSSKVGESLDDGKQYTLRERYINNYFILATVLNKRDQQYPDRVRAMVQRELPNLQHALRLLLETGDVGMITAVAGVLISFLDSFGRWRERDAVREDVLKAIRPASAQGSGMLTWAVYWQERRLGQHELETGDWQNAVKRFQALLFAIEMLPEGDEIGRHSIPHITTLQLIERGYHIGGQLDESARHLEQALAIIEECLKKDQENTDLKQVRSSLLVDQGDVLRDQGKYDQAEQVYKAAEKEGDQLNQAIILTQLGSLAVLQERFKEAHQRYKQVRNRFTLLGDDDKAANAWHQLGITAENESLDLQSKRLAQAAQGLANTPDTSAQEQELLVEAENDYRESLRLRDLLGDDAAAAADCHQLAILTERTGRYTEAKYWYEQALARMKRISSTSLNYAKCLSNLATLLINEHFPDRMAHLAEAREYAEEALAITEPLPVQDGTWMLYRVLGTIAELQGRSEDAQNYRRQERNKFADFPGHREYVTYRYGQFIASIVGAAQGDMQARASAEAVLVLLEQNDLFRPVALAVRHIWNGERNWETLVQDVDPQNALLLLLILEALGK